MAGTTVGALIEQTRGELVGPTHTRLLQLAADIDASASSITFTTTPKMASGAYVEIGDELMYVLDVQTTANAATVIRGQNGTVGAAHVAGDIIEAQPRFPRYKIRQALLDEIRSWPDEIFRVVEADIAIAVGTSIAALPSTLAGYRQVLALSRSPLTGSTRVLSLKATVLPSAPGYVNGAIRLADVASGAFTARVAVAMPFDLTVFTNATTTPAIGIDDAALDIPVLGAQWRLNSGTETQRMDTRAQGEARDATELAPGSRAANVRGLLGLRDKRLAEEAVRLRGRYPWRMA